jgi:hypothetical protein
MLADLALAGRYCVMMSLLCDDEHSSAGLFTYPGVNDLDEIDVLRNYAQHTGFLLHR